MHMREKVRSIKLSTAEKDSCVPIIRSFIEIIGSARPSGYLLALDAAAEIEKDPFLKAGLRLVADGTKPACVKSILRNLISAENPTGLQLFTKLLLLEGIMALQRGDNPRMIEMRQLAMLGEEYLGVFD